MTPKQKLIEAVKHLNKNIRNDKTIEYGILYNDLDYYAGCRDTELGILKLIEGILPDEQ